MVFWGDGIHEIDVEKGEYKWNDWRRNVLLMHGQELHIDNTQYSVLYVPSQPESPHIRRLRQY